VILVDISATHVDYCSKFYTTAKQWNTESDITNKFCWNISYSHKFTLFQPTQFIV